MLFFCIKMFTGYKHIKRERKEKSWNSVLDEESIVSDKINRLCCKQERVVLFKSKRFV